MLLETDIENPAEFQFSSQQKELQTLAQSKKHEFMLLKDKAKWVMRRQTADVKIEDTHIRANQTTRTTCTLPFASHVVFRVLNDPEYWQGFDVELSESALLAKASVNMFVTHMRV